MSKLNGKIVKKTRDRKQPVNAKSHVVTITIGITGRFEYFIDDIERVCKKYAYKDVTYFMKFK